MTSDADLARSLHLHINHPLRLFSWNTSYSYPNKTVDSVKCNTWTLRHVTRHASWLQLPGRKSLFLSSYMGDHSLLVFTDRSRLDRGDQVERLVSEVSLRYHDCNATTHTADLVQATRDRLTQSSSHCHQHQRLETRHCVMRSFSGHSSSGDLRPVCEQSVRSNVSQCSDTDHSNIVQSQSVDDEVKFLSYEHQTEQRKLGKYYHHVRVSVEWSDEYNASSDPVSGLYCSDNRSVNIVLVDSSPGGYSLLADSLGVDLTRDQGPVLVLVSAGEETVSVLPAHHDNLTQALETALTGHHDQVLSGQYGLRSSESSARVQVGADTVSSCVSGGQESCIREVSRSSFTEQVLRSNKSVVLLYTSSYCSQCSVAGHVLHAVSAVLQDAGVEDVEFRMMESTRNDPPLQYTALAYPSIIFFPRNNSHNSRVFPSYKEINITSLLNFVLSNLSSRHRLSLALSSCDIKCLQRLKLNTSLKLASLENNRRRWSRYIQTLVNKQIKHVR